MILPALFIAAAFISGIAILAPLPAAPALWLGLVTALLLTGFGCVRREWYRAGLICGISAWAFLGALAGLLEKIAVPADHVTLLFASGQIDSSDALRWRGRLRGDPVCLPTGVRYEIDLEQVEIAGSTTPVTGGLRLNWYRNERAPDTPANLRAGDRVQALVRARPPRNFMDPGAADMRSYLARQGVHLIGTLRSQELLERLDSPPPTFSHRLARIRGRLLDLLDQLFAASPEHAAFLRAMLLGDYSFIDHDLADLYQRTSVYHILVISGAHLAILAAATFWIGRRLRLPSTASILLTLFVLAAFLGVVEDSPPVARAGVMAAIVLFARAMFRRVDLLNTIALAAILLLLLQPASLFDPSFQLSFLAAAMIGALAMPAVEGSSARYRRALQHLSDVSRDAGHPPRAAQLRLDLRAASAWLATRLPRRWGAQSGALAISPVWITLTVWEIFLLSAVIQLGMLPLMAHYFHRVSFNGFLANIPAALLSSLIVPLGFFALCVTAVSSTLGSLFTWLLGSLVTLLNASISWCGHWHAGSYRIPGPPFWLLVSFFAALLFLTMAARLRWRRPWLLAGTGVLLAIALAIAIFPFAPRLATSQFQLTVLDVGQGDSLFAAFPDGRTLLIDGGGLFGRTAAGGYRTGLDVGEQVVSPYLWSLGLKRLDIVTLTHAHLDHMDGLAAVLDNFQVGELWVGHDIASPSYRALLDRASAHAVRIVHHRSGDFFESGGAIARVLWPDDTSEVSKPSNNDSLALHISFGADSFLLAGDIERDVEARLLSNGVPLSATFLKVGHHGSKTSTTDAFLASVAPRVAAISVGENNPFGHPHPAVLERLDQSGARVLRTSRDGSITLLSDGHSIRMSTFAAMAH